MVATYKSKTAETRTGAMANWGWSTGASGYDDEDRLVSWTRDDNNLSQSWTLTKEGDWSQFVENTTTENRTHGPAHELTAIGSTALSYDPKGNLTVDNTKNHKYTWDFDNRMSAADTDGDNVDDVTLKYDALGRRVAKTSGSATVVYVSMTQPIQYSPLAGQVVAEYASGAAPASLIEKYVYASYIDEPVLKDGTGGTVYYHRNSQYSVAALTSASGSVVERYGYEPYGELTILAADGSTVRASSSYANTFTYTGRRWDADLSLYYFRARYYDPKLGRFVGRDPLASSLVWPPYDFLSSSPTAYVDCFGYFAIDPPRPYVAHFEITTATEVKYVVLLDVLGKLRLPILEKAYEKLVLKFENADRFEEKFLADLTCECTNRNGKRIIAIVDEEAKLKASGEPLLRLKIPKFSKPVELGNKYDIDAQVTLKEKYVPDGKDFECALYRGTVSFTNTASLSFSVLDLLVKVGLRIPESVAENIGAPTVQLNGFSGKYARQYRVCCNGGAAVNWFTFADSIPSFSVSDPLLSLAHAAKWSHKTLSIRTRFDEQQFDEPAAGGSTD